MLAAFDPEPETIKYGIRISTSATNQFYVDKKSIQVLLI